jgi:hypothetical protein
MTIAADPKHLGARVGAISVLHTWGSAPTHHPHVQMIARGGGLSPDGCAGSPAGPASFCPCALLFRRLFLERLLAAFDASPVAVRWRPRRSRGARRVHGVSRACAQGRMGRLCQTTIRWPRGRFGLSGALHPSRRHRQQPADCASRRRRWPAAPARITSPGCASCSRRPRSPIQTRLPMTPASPIRPTLSLPMLRRPYDRRRDVRTRRPFVQPDKDRHLMIEIPLPLVSHRRLFSR